MNVVTLLVVLTLGLAACEIDRNPPATSTDSSGIAMTNGDSLQQGDEEPPRLSLASDNEEGFDESELKSCRVSPTENDRPLIGAYPDSEVYVDLRTVDFDLITMPAGPMKQHVDEPERALNLEGKIQSVAYTGPEGATEIMIGRSYEQALGEAGFGLLYTCVGEECGNLLSFMNNSTFKDMGNGFTRWGGYNERSRFYLAGCRDLDNRARHLLLYVSRYSNSSTQMRINLVTVEGAPLEAPELDVTVLEASELQETLETEGKVTVTGIFFDLDSANLRSESTDALEQMAALMNDSDYNVLVAGHTDNQGTEDYNDELSTRRAQAVRRALVNDHGVDAGRMTARGFGFSQPVASNDTEEGREQNRRVELVLQ